MAQGAWHTAVGFILEDSDADVTREREAARQIAGRILRAAAHSMQQGQPQPLTLRLPADSQTAAITGASLLLLAQQIDPAAAHVGQRWQRPAARHDR
ncbi:hypothetical protein Uis1B_0198 [Bifidobacterium margollesii]|uniref:Uncharacterized protein n=1 Tax=Bifidobacterium margollesii TaxID=2020964 RepID=A0A2N5JD52_9BIFI|nr:hypothetical protein [Bifidobacterium margollesii]PLS32105.1 hypothetical protein Uis1B_0198 [Bifidobacterium margollesii]